MINKTTKTTMVESIETNYKCSECGCEASYLERRKCLICGRECCNQNVNYKIEFPQIEEDYNSEDSSIMDFVYEDVKGYICSDCENSKRYQKYIKAQDKIMKSFNTKMKQLEI